MKLIDLYIDELRQYLPPKNREDVLQEIRSTLMDMVEDRTPSGQDAPSDDIIKAVLKEYGAPRAVARQYNRHQYLIGPRLYPTYLKVLRIALPIVAAVSLVVFFAALISLNSMESGMLETVFTRFAGIFSSLFTAAMIITFIFAVLERTTPEDWRLDSPEEWAPDDLLKREAVERINIPGVAVEITMAVAFIVFLNFFLGWAGIYYLTADGFRSAPLLTDLFVQFVPWITAFTIMDILLNLYLIRSGQWDKAASIAKIVINLFKIGVLLAMIISPALVRVDPDALQALNIGDLGSATAIATALNVAFDVVLGLAIVGLLIEAGKRLYADFLKPIAPSVGL